MKTFYGTAMERRLTGLKVVVAALPIDSLQVIVAGARRNFQLMTRRMN